MPSDIAVLIFSGSNQRAVIAFCRFAAANGIRVHIVARNATDTIFLTHYSSWVISTRVAEQFSVDEFSNYIDSADSELLILPSTEFLNRFLISNRTALESLGCVIPVCDGHLYEKISDKYAFSELCVASRLRIPAELNEPDHFTNAFVAKPRRYISDDGDILKPELILDDMDWRNFKNRIKASDFYYQEFIGGSSHYLLFYFEKNGDYVVYSQENLVQQHNGGSIILAKSSMFHLDDFADKMAGMFQSSSFHGLVMVEVKKFNGEIFVIEANPRLWGPSQLILDSNMDLFHRFALDNRLIKDFWPRSYIPDVYYFWEGGITENRIANKSVAHHQYTEEKYISDKLQFQKNEVYARTDTFQIHALENQIQ